MCEVTSKKTLYGNPQNKGHKELAVVRCYKESSGDAIGRRLLSSENVKRARRCSMYSRQVRWRQCAAQDVQRGEREIKQN
jgi:hypothetical protein